MVIKCFEGSFYSDLRPKSTKYVFSADVLLLGSTVLYPKQQENWLLSNKLLVFKSSIYIQKYNYHVATILQLCQLKSQLCIKSFVVFVELCAQTWPYPVKQRNVVKQVGVGKCNDTESFAELWTPALRESEIKEVIFKNGEQ